MTANRNIAGVHAYEHAREARPAPRHRVDVVDEPTLDYGAPPKPRPHPNPYPPAPPAVDRYVEYGQQRRSDYLTHKVDAPTSTAFKFGFGFAAGEALFRLIVAAGGLTAILILAAVAYSAVD